MGISLENLYVDIFGAQRVNKYVHLLNDSEE